MSMPYIPPPRYPNSITFDDISQIQQHSWEHPSSPNFILSIQSIEKFIENNSHKNGTTISTDDKVIAIRILFVKKEIRRMQMLNNLEVINRYMKHKS